MAADKTFSPTDIAMAAMTHQLALTNILVSKGVLTKAEADDAANRAIAGLSESKEMAGAIDVIRRTFSHVG